MCGQVNDKRLEGGVGAVRGEGGREGGSKGGNSRPLSASKEVNGKMTGGENKSYRVMA